MADCFCFSFEVVCRLLDNEISINNNQVHITAFLLEFLFKRNILENIVNNGYVRMSFIFRFEMALAKKHLYENKRC